jgi:hypothetical protein
VKPEAPFEEEKMAQTARRGGSEFENFEGGAAGGGEIGDDSAEVEYEDGEGYTVDLSETPDSVEYPVYPRGIYSAELAEMTYGQSQRSGNNMWTCILELTDPALAEQNKGRAPRQWLHLTFNDGGLPRVKQFLARIKCDDDANLALLKGKFDPEKVADEGRLLGAKMRVKLDVRRYEGKNRNNVRDVLPPAADGKSGFAQL